MAGEVYRHLIREWGTIQGRLSAGSVEGVHQSLLEGRVRDEQINGVQPIQTSMTRSRPPLARSS